MAGRPPGPQPGETWKTYTNRMTDHYLRIPDPPSNYRCLCGAADLRGCKKHPCWWGFDTAEQAAKYGYVAEESK